MSIFNESYIRFFACLLFCFLLLCRVLFVATRTQLYSKEMWAGVLFFLFCVGFVFFVFEHINIWIQKDHVEAPTKSSSKINLVESIKLEMAETPFLSSKFIFKRVSLLGLLNMLKNFHFILAYFLFHIQLETC